MIRDTIIALMNELERARLEARERADRGSFEVAWKMLDVALEGLVAETRARLEPPTDPAE